MTEPAFATDGPVFNVGGQLVRELARDCVRLEISEGLQGLRTLQAYFLAVGPGATGPQDRLLHLDGKTVDLGKALKVSIGSDVVQRIVFDGAVSALEVILDDGEPPLVVVLAEDALMRLRMTRRLRTYRKISDAGIANEIAGLHRMQADLAAEGPSYDLVQQFNQSDLAFLRERARLVQAEIWCTGQTLHFRSRSKREAPALTLVRGADLLSVRLCADLAHQRSEVMVSGFDAQGTEIVDERATADLIDTEITSGRTGAKLVSQALGPSATLRVREVALKPDQAKAWARAEMLRRGRRFVTVTGMTRGSPDMVVGSRLRLAQVGAPFEGEGYYTTQVTHTFDHTHGFQTRFQAERATVNEGA